MVLKLQSGHDFVTENATYKAQGGKTQTNIHVLRFLCSARRQIFLWSFMNMSWMVLML